MRVLCVAACVREGACIQTNMVACVNKGPANVQGKYIIRSGEAIDCPSLVKRESDLSRRRDARGRNRDRRGQEEARRDSGRRAHRVALSRLHVAKMEILVKQTPLN